MRKELWNKGFILPLQRNAVSTIGDLMYSVAIGYWVYEQTGSSGLILLKDDEILKSFLILTKQKHFAKNSQTNAC